MKKKITMVILVAALILLAACGKNNENENTNTTVTGSEAGSEAPSENEKLSDASGTVIAVHTTALCLSTESGAGYDGFIAVGEQAELTGISDKWYAIKYNGKTYYVLAKYMETADAEAGTVAETEASTAAGQSETTSDVQTPEDKNNVPDNTTGSAGNNTSLNKPAGNKNTAQQATQPAGNKNNTTGKNNTGSNTPAPTKAAVWHDPVYDTKQVWVVDKAAWTEEVKAPRQVPIYETVGYIECTCGYMTKDENEWDAHADMHMDKEEPYAYRVIGKREITGYETQYDISYINHPEEGHYESQTVLVQDGYWE